MTAHRALGRSRRHTLLQFLRLAGNRKRDDQEEQYKSGHKKSSKRIGKLHFNIGIIAVEWSTHCLLHEEVQLGLVRVQSQTNTGLIDKFSHSLAIALRRQEGLRYIFKLPQQASIRLINYRLCISFVTKPGTMRLILTLLLLAITICSHERLGAQIIFHRGYYDAADTRSYGIRGALIETNRGDFVFNIDNGLVCTDSFGVPRWTKDYSTTGSVPPQYLQTNDLLALPDGNFMVFGKLVSATGSSHDSILVSRLTPSGLVVWCKVLSVPLIANSLNHRKAILTSDGNILFCVSHNIGYAGYALATLMDQSGIIQWQRVYRVNPVGTPINDFLINDVSECANGDFIICGSGYASADINIVARINGAGALLWSRQLDASTTQTKQPSAARELSNGDIRVIIQKPMQDWGKAFITLDNAGNVKGGGKALNISDVPNTLIAPSGDMYFAGFSDTIGFAHLDSSGAVVAAYYYDPGVRPTLGCVTATHDNGFILGGLYTSSSLGFGRGYLVKTASAGQAPPFATPVHVDTIGYTATSLPLNMRDSMVAIPFGYVALTSVANIMDDTLFAASVSVPFVGSSLAQPCVYPNPAQHVVSFTTGKAYDVKVLTMTGSTVMALSQVQHFDISKLPAGVYMLALSDAQGKTYGLQRLVKE